jgi:fumarylacetoacetate (FAA) hydrolase
MPSAGLPYRAASTANLDGGKVRLASLKGGRDGRLIVVSSDLSQAVLANAIAPTLQAALDDWPVLAPRLKELSVALERGEAAAFPFSEADCASPLPRAYQWADGSAYVNHVDLVRRARGDVLPASFWIDPLIYQGGSDDFTGPRDPILAREEAHGIDCEAEIAVITDDVPMGVTPDAARGHIRLLMLVNDVSLRGLIPAELAKGFGFFQGKPSTTFAPLAITPDECGPAWTGAKLHGPVLVSINGRPFGCADAGIDMTFDFGQLIAHAARTRRLRAGTVIGSGTVSNRGRDGGPGRPIASGGSGYSCIAEQRMVETLETGAPVTPFLVFGDQVKIEMRNAHGRSLFGAIDQRVDQAP